jgi:mRNA-degrading endonuclease RelE of RelBE toxin-antitoxin system
MKIKDQAIKELEELKPGNLLKVYDLIISLKRRPEEEKRKKGLPAYQRVRRALKQCKSSLSEDILVEREDRI